MFNRRQKSRDVSRCIIGVYSVGIVGGRCETSVGICISRRCTHLCAVAIDLVAGDADAGARCPRDNDLCRRNRRSGEVGGLDGGIVSGGVGVMASVGDRVGVAVGVGVDVGVGIGVGWFPLPPPPPPE